MLWWVWVALGVTLICTEIFVPLNFYLIFIGLGFCTTGGLVSLELLSGEWMQWVAAGVFSLIFYVGLKDKISTVFSGSAEMKEDYVGETVTIKSDIAPGQVGAGSLRGTGWQVKNKTEVTLAAGSKHQVKKTDGITLVIE